MSSSYTTCTSASSSQPSTQSSDIDVRGVMRGRCTVIGCNCDHFQLGTGTRCSFCYHPPTKHKKIHNGGGATGLVANFQTIQLDGGDSGSAALLFQSSEHRHDDSTDDNTSDESDDSSSSSGDDSDTTAAVDSCRSPGCSSSVGFDPNTGEPFQYCNKHMYQQPHYPHQLVPSPVPLLAPVSLPSPVPPPASVQWYGQQYYQETCKLPGCHKPCFVDYDGNAYEFCCHSHGRRYHEQRSNVVPAHLKCKNPSCQRQKYQEENVSYDFCGRRCRDKYIRSQQFTIPSPTAGVTLSVDSCRFPGCQLACYRDPNEGTMLFCGNEHKVQAQQIVLLELSRQAEEYAQTVAHFTQSWSPQKSSPPASNDILAIFRVFNPKRKNIFDEYTQCLGNTTVEKHYHGTSIRCDLLQQRVACSDDNCGVCGISRRGFKRGFIASNIARFTRFGTGFYLAPNSSKCHDYTQGIVNYRVMLLCEVAPGNKYIVKNDHTKWKSPPQGYDSVYGKRGGNLNYDEIVLYCSEAILPLYAIIYRRDGINQIAN